MCGVVGVLDPGFGRSGGPEAITGLIGAMADTLVHRGPDDKGVWVDADAGVALGFRRLAILDLSAQGRQPMTSASGRYVIVFNGEIYNHGELRQRLEGDGARRWRGHSDTEILLAYIDRHGVEETLGQLNGMFAIGLWDRERRELWLARDRMGEKPLYYGECRGVFFFSSELKALRRHPAFDPELDGEAVALFLRHAFIPSPHSIYRGISKLSPGHVLRIPIDEWSAAPRPYWHAADVAEAQAAAPFAGTEAEAMERLGELTEDAVKLRSVADVPLGAFLSGGIDSSTVVAAMTRTQAPGNVRTFSVGFEDPRYDESPHAEAVARHLRTDHTTLMMSEDDCLEVVLKLPQMFDEPFADPSGIPTAVLCRLTAGHVTVSMSGDGGDELFGGYARYLRAARAWSKVAGTPQPLRALARSLVAMTAGKHTRPLRRLRKLAEGFSHADPYSLYLDYIGWWRTADGVAAAPVSPATPVHLPAPTVSRSLARNFMFADTRLYLPDDLMVKVDRASMAVGLESRAPFLDHRLVEFVWSLPDAMIVERPNKGLLRDVLYRSVPRDIVDRPKQGFEPPIAGWLRGALRDWADGLLAEKRLSDDGLVNPAVVRARWRDHATGRRDWTYSLWTVLMLEAWLDSVRA